MKNFIWGVIFGIVLATIGVDGVLRWVDVGVNKTQSFVKELDSE